MIRKLLLAATLCLFAAPALAQNTTCSTRPTGDSSNACASTAFVHNTIGGAFIVGTAPINASYLAGVWTIGLNVGTGLGVAGGNLNLQPASAAVIGGVNSITSASHNWIAYIDTAGLPHQSQPAFTDLSGNIAVTQMNSGTGASSTTYWRGDGTWAAVTGGRASNPTNLYVATTGSDSNNCLSSGSPCLTIGHAVNLALAYDFQGGPLTINIAAGTYTEQVNIYGPIGGSGSGKAVLNLIGAGSASTTIKPPASCASGTSAIFVDNYARVAVGSMTLTTNGCSGSDLISYEHSTVLLADGDLKLGPAGNALIQVYDHSTFTGNSNFALTIAGSATYAFLGSLHSAIILSVGTTNIITGTPAFTAFIDLIDNSIFDSGITSTFSGAATGARYSLAINSSIDTEQNTSSLPGDTVGNLASGSYYYDNNGVACIASNAGCRVASPAPSGLGTGGTASVASGSGDQNGRISMLTGTSPGTTGAITLATPSILEGATGQSGGNCAFSINNISATWPVGSTVQGYYNTSNGTLNLTWSSNGTSLSVSASYNISYMCM